MYTSKCGLCGGCAVLGFMYRYERKEVEALSAQALSLQPWEGGGMARKGISYSGVWHPSVPIMRHPVGINRQLCVWLCSQKPLQPSSETSSDVLACLSSLHFRLGQVEAAPSLFIFHGRLKMSLVVGTLLCSEADFSRRN